MYHKEYPITLTPEIVRGALSIYLEAHRKRNFKRMLFGLSLLKGVSEILLDAAIESTSQRLVLSAGEIRARLTGPLPEGEAPAT